MNYLPLMTEDEIKYVCSVIPLKDSVWYFKRYPRDFAKVMRGFRATSLKNQEQVSDILFKNRHLFFISSFIEKHISQWLEEIQQEISIIMDKGESKVSAWLQILPFCFFVDDISIFFKLIGEKVPAEDIVLLGLSIKRINNLDIAVKKSKYLLNKKEEERICLKKEINHVKSEMDKSHQKLIECSDEIKTLNQLNSELKNRTDIICAKEHNIKILEKKIQERDTIIQQLKSEISGISNQQLQLERKTKGEVKSQNNRQLIELSTSSKPRCPRDIDEFRDYLGYNLEKLGIETSSDFFPLLKDYLCNILFTGTPIIVSRNTGCLLMKCVSNALVSSTNVATLVFAPEISVAVIEEFLSGKNRIVCLDNFIGYFDEAILSTICDRHKDKILFLTVAFDKTLRYVPVEFLKYCHYLNVNRIDAFIHAQELTEEPYTVEEIETSNRHIKPDVIWAPFFKEILAELNLCNILSAYKSMLVSDEKVLCQLLAFDILPYCIDVLDIMPYNSSDRFNKYTSNQGRCPYKGLFRRWFS